MAGSRVGRGRKHNREGAALRRCATALAGVGDARAASRRRLAAAPDPADRRMVVLSGDGIANIGPPVREVRDELVAAGITINGLAILASEPWLESYYDEYVIGGPRAFLLRAEEVASFANPMPNKMLSEISGLPPPAAMLAQRRPAGPPFAVSRSPP